MKIQKRKFLSNLARIRIFQQSHPQFQRLLTPFRFMHALFLCFFMVIHTTDVSGNLILSFIKQTQQGIPPMPFLTFILSALLTIISVFIILPLLFLSRKERGLEYTEYNNHRSRLLLKCAAICTSLFKYSAPLLMMPVISGVQINCISDIYLYLIHFVSILSCQAVIIFCKEPIIYSYKLAFLSLSLIVLPPFEAHFLIAVVTLYCLQSKDNSFQHQTGYLVILILAFILMAEQQTQDIIGELHLTLILALVIAIKLAYQPVFPLLPTEKENDFLLMVADKLNKEEDLSKQEIMQIVYINEEFQSKCQSLSKEGFEFSQNFQPESFKQFEKSDVLRLLRLKLDIDAKIHPNANLISIQRFECQLLDKPFSIMTLYQIEKLNLEVQESCIYEDIYRMQALINKIEVKFLKIEDEINSSLIFKIEKQLQNFYICIGEGIEQLLALWKTIMIKEVSQDVFENSISKMIGLETESLKILEQLSKYKDMGFQKNLFNYWRKITNVNINNYFNEDSSKKNYTMMETKFLLISNGIIEDASHTIAKKITMNKEEQLMGLKISEILYDFYNKFLERELNTIISISDVHKEIVIPFRILNHEKRFFPSSCNFKILPNFSQGVKYIINFVDRKQDTKKYALYCMESDTIEGFSQSFFEKYKIDESLLPDIISGQDVFNTAISAHIIQEKISVGMAIRCQLKFNDLRKQSKASRASRHSIPLMVTIRDIYQAKQLNYVLLEMATREETAILSAHDTIKQFVAEGNEQQTNTSYSTTFHQNFCKIRNPLESVIDDKLSRINVKSRISYFKIILALMLLALVLLILTFILIRMDTASTGNNLHHQLDIVSDTNTLIQKLYSLFYQYYQYYQIKNYPQQILSIQQYNITALYKQYKTKANENIADLLPLILNNQNPQHKSYYNLTYSNYSTTGNTIIINLVEFLEMTKTTLATNDPTHLVANYHIIYNFIDSFVPFNNEVLEEFRVRVYIWAIALFVCLMLICLAIRALHLRITLFKWSILKVYSEITEAQIKKYSRRLEDFINLLVRIKYYNQHNTSAGTLNKGRIKGFSTRDTFGEEFVQARLSTSKEVEIKGVKLKSTSSQLLSNNMVFLVPIVIGGFLWLYYRMVVSYDQQSDIVLDYFAQLQELTVLILKKATEFFQASLEADIIPNSDEDIHQSPIFSIPTRLHQQLPTFFQDYKKVENQMLNFNLCEYSYLNTGSLYKGIDCGAVLDGMMNRGFTQTYAFLLQAIEALRGAPLSALGAQVRPSAQYPFFMEVCYARRTINNMLAVVQGRFAGAVDGFLAAQQASLQSAVAAGLALLPLAAGLFWLFARRLRGDCQKAIKCFRILPRPFLMRIAVSKKLHKLGALQQIQLIAT